MEFHHHLPVNIVFGAGKAAEASRLTRPHGKKALIVTGRSSAKRSGLYGRVNDALHAEGIETFLFDKVTQNPLTTTAEAGAAFARENGCDVVVAIGGGSVMDCAKSIAFLSVNDGDINDYIFGRLASDKALPIILIPTTCGTGSEGNGYAVLTNPANGDKKSLRSPAIIAKASIVDPECMMTMPKKVLAAVGFDALCHCMEAYTSRAAHPFSDALSLYGVGLIADSLIDLYNGSDELEKWEELCLGSTIGGMAIGMASVTLPHAMEHPASGLKDIVHGEGLAALTPLAIDISLPGARERYGKISGLLGGTGPDDCAGRVRSLLGAIGLDITLGDLGISEDDIPWMAANCIKIFAGGVANNPVVLTQDEIAGLYKKAL